MKCGEGWGGKSMGQEGLNDLINDLIGYKTLFCRRAVTNLLLIHKKTSLLLLLAKKYVVRVTS